MAVGCRDYARDTTYVRSSIDLGDASNRRELRLVLRLTAVGCTEIRFIAGASNGCRSVASRQDLELLK